MADQNVQDANPQGTANAADATQPSTNQSAVSGTKLFPDPNSERRLGDYHYYMRLLMGEHFEAFNIRINDERYTREYSKLRYIMVNFAGLVSKIVADMLFSEPPKFKAPSGDKKDQEWLDALVSENKLNTQNYESAVNNSALGDALYKVRVGERLKGDGKPTVIIEDTTPMIYFPEIDGFNVRAEPSVRTLAWTFYKGKDKYLRKEIHTTGQIENQVWSMENNKVLVQQNISILGDPELKEFEDTLVDRPLVVHVPNWRTSTRYFGISDYRDLDKLFYAINNRFTKLDNILDKHGDPILAVPPGVLDEKGNVKKKDGRIIEVGDGEDGKPEYIVWDASLESAFKEIDKLVDVFFMVSEIAPDALGMGKGQADTGRALKLKLLRTIAKVARKKLYYHDGLREVIYIAGMVAKEHNLEIDGLTAPDKPFKPDIEWQDGIPIDTSEQADTEAVRLGAGNTSVKDSIMRLDGVDEATAEKKAKEIKDESALAIPPTNLGNGFGPGKTQPTGGGSGGTANPDAAGKGQKPPVPQPGK